VLTALRESLARAYSGSGTGNAARALAARSSPWLVVTTGQVVCGGVVTAVVPALVALGLRPWRCGHPLRPRNAVVYAPVSMYWRAAATGWIGLASVLTVGATIVACSSKGGSGGAPDGGGACGLALFPQDYPSSCQTAADQTCCTQEQACGANADCVNLVKCVNGCPVPRQDSCVSSCGPAGGYTELNALADCSKTQPPTYDAGSTSCAWPR
jgi:hypothetical protein